jgi:hypothetical protein
MTRSSNTWSCCVSIRREFDIAGNKLNEIRETPFGDCITNKDEVEDRLRRAQLTILYPDIEESEWLRCPPDELYKLMTRSKGALSFSRNAVCVDLDGDGLPDLAFIDLPGMYVVSL